MSKGEIGFVGLGRMGFTMARNLARAGYRVHVHDIATAAVERAAQVAGVVPHASTRAVAGASSVVFTALPNDAIVRETYFGPSGLLQCRSHKALIQFNHPLANIAQEKLIPAFWGPVLSCRRYCRVGKITISWR